MQLQGKRAVITGGASGIGFATAEELLRNGVSRILILDLGASLNANQEVELKQCNPNASVFYSQCDVTDKTQLEQVLRSDAMQWLGSIDVLVNSAGMMDETKPSRTVAVNLLGVIDCSMTAMELMSKVNSGNGGCIVNIASIAGLEGYPICAAYCASKFGVIGFTKSIGMDIVFNKTGIKSMAICPGATDTPILKNCVNSRFTFPWIDGQSFLQRFKTQKPSAVGKAVVKAIIEGKNGSVWVASEEEIKMLPLEPNKYTPSFD